MAHFVSSGRTLTEAIMRLERMLLMAMCSEIVVDLVIYWVMVRSLARPRLMFSTNELYAGSSCIVAEQVVHRSLFIWPCSDVTKKRTMFWVFVVIYPPTLLTTGMWECRLGEWHLFLFIELVSVQWTCVFAAGTHGLVTLTRQHTRSMLIQLRSTVYHSTHTVNSFLPRDLLTRSVIAHTCISVVFSSVSVWLQLFEAMTDIVDINYC